MNSHYYTLINFLTGTLAAASSFTITLMEHIEIGLRIGTSFLGLIIAGLTIRNLWRNRK
jgi:hypothetical protein